MTLWQWFQSRGVLRDAVCVVLGYWLASTWGGKLWLLAALLTSVTGAAFYRRWSEHWAYHDARRRLESIEAATQR